MSKINNDVTKSSFFPKNRNTHKAKNFNKTLVEKNDITRQKELESATGTHAKVDISDKIRDFAKIKSAVDRSPEIDNSGKVNKLREQIKSGKYKVDYDALAEKILATEF